MEEARKEMEKAQKHLRMADHLLTQTYPSLQSPKLLLVVIENIFLALAYSINTVIKQEKHLGAVESEGETFEDKFNIFKLKIAKKYGIQSEVVIFIQDLKEILQLHKKSPLEFERKGKFIICSDRFGSVKTISEAEVKKHLNKAKLFVHFVEKSVLKT